MNNIIRDLLDRMDNNSYREGEVVIDGTFESSKTISWEAYDEVRKMADSSLIEDLFENILSESKSGRKQNLYFILRNVTINTKSELATRFLVERLSKEKGKELLVTILGGLPDLFKPRTIDISPILKCAESKNWNVRGSAFEALTNSDFDVEGYLEKKLVVSQNNTDLWHLLNAIRYVGTSRVIEAINPYLKSRAGDVKNTAIFTLAIILLRDGFELEYINKRVKLSIPTLEMLKERLPVFTRPPAYLK